MAEQRLDLDGPVAPPRRNGELVFAEPWESRVFGLTMALREAGLFEWDEFRSRLIEAIRQGELNGEDLPYWQAWRRAFESLLGAKGICAGADLDARTHALAARPPGHDHD
jgi:nitrile hydratase accessory protein